MDFFARQDQVRRNTWHLLGLFALAVILIVLAVNLAAHGAIVLLHLSKQGGGHLTQQMAHQVPFYMDAASKIRFHSGLCLATLLVIGLTCWYRISRLSGSGGDRLAIELGGVWVDPATTDPALRRLVNVTEEMVIAAGIPHPSLYVLKAEPGINALAAGWDFEDAVVMVSQGALERLTRDELQGVVAHEFSHILSGDMRLNIRMIGVLYGILALSVVGKTLIRGGARNRKNGVALLIGLALMVIGSFGVFFARLIRAGVSRQREFFADASAVQLTRNPAGLAGALRKIGGFGQGSRMGMARREEVSHMFFASGQDFWTRIMATHPPLPERIRALGHGGVLAGDFPESADRAGRTTGGVLREVKNAFLSPLPQEEDSRAADRQWQTPLMLRDWTDDFADSLRQDTEKEIAAGSQARAGSIRERIPEALLAAARSQEKVEALLSALFLGGEREMRDKKMRLVWDRLGDGPGRQAKTLLAQVDALPKECILSLADLSSPALRHLPEGSRERMTRLLDELAALDGTLSVFEYCFIRLLKQRLSDTNRPAGVVGFKRPPPARIRQALVNLFSVFARHGHHSDAVARAAFSRGIARLLPRTVPAYTPPVDWSHDLDNALAVLDALSYGMKEQVLAALLETASCDGEFSTEELKLLRLICACLHIPAPPLLDDGLIDGNMDQ